MTIFGRILGAIGLVLLHAGAFAQPSKVYRVGLVSVGVPDTMYASPRATAAISGYTTIGGMVNLASRICAAAEDGQILMDTAVAAELGEAFALTPLGTRPLRGFAEAVPVFSVRPRDVNLEPLPAAK